MLSVIFDIYLTQFLLSGAISGDKHINDILLLLRNIYCPGNGRHNIYETIARPDMHHVNHDVNAIF